MKILVVAPSWIGDTILAQPMLARLRRRHPGADIDVLAPAWCSPLLERMAEVNHVVSNPFGHGEINVANRFRLGRQLARAGYDQAIVLPNSWKSALVPFFAGVPRRTGFHGEARYGLLNDRRQLDPGAMPQLAQRYAQLAEEPGIAPTMPLIPPRLMSTPPIQAAVRATLGLPNGIAPAILCPGAEYGPAKRWPSRHFAALARQLADRGIPVWLVGSGKDSALGDEIVRLAAGGVDNLCGRTSLSQAIDVIASARFVVSNDSGLMHVAAALERPLVAIYGSSSPAYTPPLSAHAKILSLNLECSPCFRRECPLGHLRCLNDLEPRQVLAEILSHA